MSDAAKASATDVDVVFETRPPVRLSRRALLSGLAAGSVIAVTGCATNPTTGRSQLILLSDQQLARMGVQTWQALLDQDPSLPPAAPQSQELRGIGDRIVAATPNLPRYDWEYRVFERDTLNAFVVPGGKVGFYDGILDFMDSEDEVAVVMGHEVAHIAGRHSAERVSQAMAASAALTATAVALEAGDVQFSGEIAALLGVGVQFGLLLPYQRRQELEADRVGVRLMADAGYDPGAALQFWERMQSANQNRERPPAFLSTHPLDAVRIRALREEIAALV